MLIPISTVNSGCQTVLLSSQNLLISTISFVNDYLIPRCCPINRFKNHSSRVTSEMAAIPGSLVEAGRRSSSSNREGSKSFGRGGAGMA